MIVDNINLGNHRKMFKDCLERMNCTSQRTLPAVSEQETMQQEHVIYVDVLCLHVELRPNVEANIWVSLFHCVKLRIMVRM